MPKFRSKYLKVIYCIVFAFITRCQHLGRNIRWNKMVLICGIAPGKGFPCKCNPTKPLAFILRGRTKLRNPQISSKKDNRNVKWKTMDM